MRHGRGDQHALRGVVLMLVAMAILPMLDGFAKILGQHIPVLQIVWARVVFSTLVTLPFVLARGAQRWWWPNNPGVQVVRSILLMTSTGLFVTGLNHLPMADTLAIFFVMPLIVTALSPLVLKEPVDAQSWAAVAVGFAGTLIIIRPGFEEVNIGVLAALGAGFSQAIYMLLTRKIAGMTDAMVTNLHTSLAGAAIASLLVPLVWTPPTATDWALMLGIGVVAATGHYFIIRAYDFAPAPVLAPLAYTEMIGATVIGFLLFGDLPDAWTIAGVVILIASALYISLRHRRPRRVEPPGQAG
jgi:drug/metabolite transporter (DMT)-like permease